MNDGYKHENTDLISRRLEVLSSYDSYVIAVTKDTRIWEYDKDLGCARVAAVTRHGLAYAGEHVVVLDNEGLGGGRGMWAVAVAG